MIGVRNNFIVYTYTTLRCPATMGCILSAACTNVWCWTGPDLLDSAVTTAATATTTAIIQLENMVCGYFTWVYYFATFLVCGYFTWVYYFTTFLVCGYFTWVYYFATFLVCSYFTWVYYFATFFAKEFSAVQCALLAKPFIRISAWRIMMKLTIVMLEISYRLLFIKEAVLAKSNQSEYWMWDFRVTNQIAVFKTFNVEDDWNFQPENSLSFIAIHRVEKRVNRLAKQSTMPLLETHSSSSIVLLKINGIFKWHALH